MTIILILSFNQIFREIRERESVDCWSSVVWSRANS